MIKMCPSSFKRASSTYFLSAFPFHTNPFVLPAPSLAIGGGFSNTPMIVDNSKAEKLLFTKRNLENFKFCTIINYGTKPILLG